MNNTDDIEWEKFFLKSTPSGIDRSTASDLKLYCFYRLIWCATVKEIKTFQTCQFVFEHLHLNPFRKSKLWFSVYRNFQRFPEKQKKNMAKLPQFVQINYIYSYRKTKKKKIQSFFKINQKFFLKSIEFLFLPPTPFNTPFSFVWNFHVTQNHLIKFFQSNELFRKVYK